MRCTHGLPAYWSSVTIYAISIKCNVVRWMVLSIPMRYCMGVQWWEFTVRLLQTTVEWHMFTLSTTCMKRGSWRITAVWSRLMSGNKVILVNCYIQSPRGLGIETPSPALYLLARYSVRFATLKHLDKQEYRLFYWNHQMCGDVYRYLERSCITVETVSKRLLRVLHEWVRRRPPCGKLHVVHLGHKLYRCVRSC